MNNKGIISFLKDRYYLENSSPEHLVSSHWRRLHKSFKVTFGEGEVVDLRGSGFGYAHEMTIAGRLFSWATIISYFGALNGRRELIGFLRKGVSLADKMGVPFSYNCFRQICTFALLSRNFHFRGGERILIIGDGFGFLSAFIKQMLPQAKITLLDLGKTLLFQVHYCARVHPEAGHHLPFDVRTEKPNPEAMDASFVYCPAEYMEALKDFEYDIAINIASFQEMNSATVSNYFDFMRGSLKKDNLFYCCNRIEKIMEGGEVSRFFSYPWRKDDIYLVDEYCPWHRHFLSPQLSTCGPELQGVRIPFVNYFDGPVFHRLTVLSTC